MAEIAFEDVKKWGLGYLRKNHWRVAGICDYEDLLQECHFLFLRVKSTNPQITQPADFLRVFQVALKFRLIDLSKDCFPNPYNVSEGKNVSAEINARYDMKMAALSKFKRMAEEKLDKALDNALYSTTPCKDVEFAIANYDHDLDTIYVNEEAAKEIRRKYNKKASNALPSARCLSLTVVGGSDAQGHDSSALKRELPVQSIHEEIENGLDLMRGLPDDLKKVFAVLSQEALGVNNIPTQIRRRLRGRCKPNQEPINMALGRLLGLDQRRDLLRELGIALKKRKIEMLEQEILGAAKIKRRSEEDEQEFLQRVVQKVYDLSEDEYHNLSEEARSWHDKGVLAYNEGNDIPGLASADGDDDEMSDPDVDDGDEDDVTEEEEEEEEEDQEDQEDTETQDDDEEDEEDTKAKAKKAKAVAKTKTKTKTSKAAKEPKARKPRVGGGGFKKKVTDDMVISLNKTADERDPKKGRKHAQYLLYKDGMTVAKFLAIEGAKRSNLLRDLRYQHITVKAPSQS